jgi:hypothetical protein
MKINQSRDKLKVGMVVRVNGNDSETTETFDGVICEINDKGFSVKRFDGIDGIGKWCDEIEKYTWSASWENVSDIEILKDRPQAIVSVPTREDWIRVMTVSFENGWEWGNGGKDTDTEEDYWEVYKENSCLNILDYDGAIYYASKGFYQTTEPYKSKYAFITSDEFVRDWGKTLPMDALLDAPYADFKLAEYPQTIWTRVDKLKQNKMTNLIEKAKLLVMSEPQKSFRKSGITDGDDQLTQEGKELFINWLFKKNQDEFNKEIVQPLLAEDKK